MWHLIVHDQDKVYYVTMIPVVRMMMLMMTTTTTVFKHAKVVNPYPQNYGNYNAQGNL